MSHSPCHLDQWAARFIRTPPLQSLCSNSSPSSVFVLCPSPQIILKWTVCGWMLCRQIIICTVCPWRRQTLHKTICLTSTWCCWWWDETTKTRADEIDWRGHVIKLDSSSSLGYGYSNRIRYSEVYWLSWQIINILSTHPPWSWGIRR